MLTYGKETLTEDEIKKYDNQSYFGVTKRIGVIRYNNRIVGFYSMFKKGLKDEIMELSQLDILDSDRGKGYGKQFLSQIFINEPSIESITGLSIEESVSFYADLGAEFICSCDSCDNRFCGFNSSNMIISEDDELCGDYSDNFFIIARSDIFKTEIAA